MVEAAEAGIVAIDRALTGDGFPLGPFALMDLVGLDVNLATTRAVWDGLGRPDRLRPSPIQVSLVEDGALGRKARRGFYRYGDDRDGAPRPNERFEADAERSALTADAIVHRVRTAIGAEARRAAADGVASEAEIDRAVVLGANHPTGPFEWLRGENSAGDR
jgi:3-hydroxybutyryl-CoA dehydrogenase